MTDRPPYNDPFYFALPNPASGADVAKAEAHIERRFGFVGHPEVIRSELAFTLCRLTNIRRPNKAAAEVSA